MLLSQQACSTSISIVCCCQSGFETDGTLLLQKQRGGRFRPPVGEQGLPSARANWILFLFSTCKISIAFHSNHVRQ
jgi:hypothetical protein